jgi:uncharacterized protein
MTEESACFYSDGLQLDASLYLPDDWGSALSKPLLVVCSGFLGLKRIHPERFARLFTKEGYPCFGFDYRGFGKSQGVRGQVSIEEQIRDIADCLAYISAHPRVKGRRIVLMGWGMGAGLILEAARISTCVHALVCINGFYDAERVQQHLRTGREWSEFRSWLSEERARLSQTGETPDFDPFQIYPLDSLTLEYVNNELRQNPDFRSSIKFGFASSLLLFAPEKRLSHLAGIPILIAHGDNNKLHPPSEARSLYDRYPGPKTLYRLPDAGHTEWMLDGHKNLDALVSHIDGWITELQ